MSLEKLFRLSGFFLLVSGCLMLIQLILNPVDTGVTTIKEPLIVLANLLGFFGVICALFGLPAVFLRQADRAGLLGLLGMLATFFGIALSDATHTVISFDVLPVLATSTATATHLGSLDTAIQQGLQGTLGTVGGLMTLLGLLLLGIATLRAGIFPRWVGIVFIVVIPIIPLSFFVPILSNVGLELPYFALAIDLLINRTLVYSILTICIFGVYTLFVGYMGFLFQERYTLFASLLATVLVALFFQSLREWLQRSINKIMYGDRDDPYGVIVRLGQRLEATLAPDATLPIIVETVAQALKLPYAAIVLNHDAGSSIAARYGTPNGSLVHLPLVYQGEQLGELVLAPRTPGESFTITDQRLLDGLARLGIGDDAESRKEKSDDTFAHFDR